VLAFGLLLAGCGTNATLQTRNSVLNETALTVYSSLPLLGGDRAAMQSILNGEALALYDAGGRVRFGTGKRAAELHIGLDSSNDADPNLASWSPEATARSAKAAFQDRAAAAYLGDFDSGATWHSLPLTNESSVLQISPGSPYLGFTDRGPGVPPTEPGFFYPSRGRRTFARLVPSYAREARATLRLMRSLGVRRVYVLSGRGDPLDAQIAPLVAAAAHASGVALAGRASLHGGVSGSVGPEDPRRFAPLAHAIAASHADAVLYGGGANTTAAALWRELHAVLPRARLFAPSTLAQPPFLTHIGSAAASATYVTSPYLELSQYPASSHRVLREYRRLFPGVAASAYALSGYEAMRLVLAAIQRAGRQAPVHRSLLASFFSMGLIRGVIGDYRIDAHGDTTLDRFDVYRVGAGGALVAGRAIG
jgi:branched-chain amino acid transport system substrate-binding protein